MYNVWQIAQINSFPFLAEISEKPGPITKGCCKIDPNGRVEREVLTPVGLEGGMEELSDIREFVRKVEHGAAKVETKDGET